MNSEALDLRFDRRLLGAFADQNETHVGPLCSQACYRAQRRAVILECVEASHLDQHRVIVVDVQFTTHLVSLAHTLVEVGHFDAVINDSHTTRRDPLVVDQRLANRFAHANNPVSPAQK